MTRQGEKILRDWESCFRDEYIRRHPGCNENDIEREMLYVISFAFFGDVSFDDRSRIEKIR